MTGVPCLGLAYLRKRKLTRPCGESLAGLERRRGGSAPGPGRSLHGCPFPYPPGPSSAVLHGACIRARVAIDMVFPIWIAMRALMRAPCGMAADRLGGGGNGGWTFQGPPAPPCQETGGGGELRLALPACFGGGHASFAPASRTSGPAARGGGGPASLGPLALGRLCFPRTPPHSYVGWRLRITSLFVAG